MPPLEIASEERLSRKMRESFGILDRQRVLSFWAINPASMPYRKSAGKGFMGYLLATGDCPKANKEIATKLDVPLYYYYSVFVMRAQVWAI